MSINIFNLFFRLAKSFFAYAYLNFNAALVNWKRYTQPNKIYIASVVLAFLSITLIEGPIAKQVCLFLSGLGFLAGLVPRFISILKRLWSSTSGKFFVVALNAGSVYFCRAIAKQRIAETIGLPPGDFDATIGWLTIFYAAQFWACAVIFILMIASYWLFFKSCFSSLALQSIISMGDGLGLIFLMSLILTASWKTDQLFDSNLIKSSLYHLDYFTGDQLIDIAPGEKIFIHSNKTISIAKIMPNGKVDIRLYELKPFKNN